MFLFLSHFNKNTVSFIIPQYPGKSPFSFSSFCGDSLNTVHLNSCHCVHGSILLPFVLTLPPERVNISSMVNANMGSYLQLITEEEQVPETLNESGINAGSHYLSESYSVR